MSTKQTTKKFSQNCVICLKIGKLYSHEYVNNLYKAIREQTDDDVLCFTDDPTGIHPDIYTYNMQPRVSEGWWPTWNKVEIFGRDELLRYERKFYFDLDLVIQGDLSPIFESKEDWAVIRATWKGIKFRVANPHEPMYNTSIMTWLDNRWIYERWESDWRTIVKNIVGTDKWYHRSGIKPTFFPKIFYSYREGCLPRHYWENNEQPCFEYRPEFSVCLFHQEPPITDLSKDHPLYKHWSKIDF